MRLKKNFKKAKPNIKESSNKQNSKKRILKKLSKLISDFFLFSTFIFLIIVISLSVISKSTGNIPKIGGFQIYSVTGGSMEPRINMGSIVFVKNTKQDLKKGDIITFLHPNDKTTIVTHRIISINEGKTPSYITQGDANENADIQPVPKDCILGRLIFSIPYLGFLMNFAKTKLGIVLFIIIPCSLVILYQLLKLIWLLILKRQLRYALILKRLNSTNAKAFKKE